MKTKPEKTPVSKNKYSRPTAGIFTSESFKKLKPQPEHYFALSPRYFKNYYPRTAKLLMHSTINIIAPGGTRMKM